MPPTETRNDELLEADALGLLLALPFMRAGVRPEFPMDEPNVKRLCRMFEAPVDDRMLERFAAEQGKDFGNWTATDVVCLLTWLNIRALPT